jgi:hypothetical protein
MIVTAGGGHPPPQPAAGGKRQEVRMIYGHNPGPLLEDGPSAHAEKASRRSSARAFQAWQAMDDAQRLALVERTLAAAANKNLSDGYPAAL